MTTISNHQVNAASLTRSRPRPHGTSRADRHGAAHYRGVFPVPSPRGKRSGTRRTRPHPSRLPMKAFLQGANDDAARTTTPPPKRARVAAPLPFAKGADVMDVRGVSSRAFGAQFCAVDGREILLCGHDGPRRTSRGRNTSGGSSRTIARRARPDDDVSSAPATARSSDDDVSRVGDVVIRGTDGLVARADGAVIRVYDAERRRARRLWRVSAWRTTTSPPTRTRGDEHAPRDVPRRRRRDAHDIVFRGGARIRRLQKMPRANLAATTAGASWWRSPRARARRRRRRERVVITQCRARVAHGRHVPARVPGHALVGEPARPVLHVARARSNERISRERTNESRDRAFRRGGGGDGRVVFRHAPPRRRGGGIRRRRQAGPRREPAPALSFPRDGREPRRARALGDPRRRDVDAETRRVVRRRRVPEAEVSKMTKKRSAPR